MAERVVLHVGAMKSGTSYLQALLFDRAAELGDAGVLVPGDDWGQQAAAVRQVLEPKRRRRPVWDTLCGQVAEHRGTAVVSMEFLGPASPATARRVVADLGAPVTDVVVTARDLNRTLVSMWQETVQNGRSWGWADYLDDARAKAPGDTAGVQDRSTPGGTFWRQQNLVRMIDDWGSVVGPERVGLVTVPAPGGAPSELAHRFAEAGGLSFADPVEVRTANESLGLASILVLRRLNELLDERGLVFPDGSGLRKRVLAKQVLSKRKREEPSLGLEVLDWVREQTDVTREALQRRGVRIVGDWSDLDPVAVRGQAPDDVDAAQVGEAALEGLAGLIVSQARTGRRGARGPG